MRLGFIFGFLIGALVASVAGEQEPAGAGVTTEGESVIEKVKAQARQALAVAREASAQKEAEMMREFEAAKQHHSD